MEKGLIGKFVVVRKHEEDIVLLVVDKYRSYRFDGDEYLGVDAVQNFVSFEPRHLKRITDEQYFKAVKGLLMSTYDLFFVTEKGNVNRLFTERNLSELKMKFYLSYKKGDFKPFKDTHFWIEETSSQDAPKTILMFDKDKERWKNYKEDE